MRVRSVGKPEHQVGCLRVGETTATPSPASTTRQIAAAVELGSGMDRLGVLDDGRACLVDETVEDAGGEQPLAGGAGLVRGIELDLDEHRTDLLWALTHPDLYLLLVHQRGWKPDAYERWLTDTLSAQLLVPAAGGRS